MHSVRNPAANGRNPILSLTKLLFPLEFIPIAVNPIIKAIKLTPITIITITAKSFRPIRYRVSPKPIVNKWSDSTIGIKANKNTRTKDIPIENNPFYDSLLSSSIFIINQYNYFQQMFTMPNHRANR
jgi:hypothetical protein